MSVLQSFSVRKTARIGTNSPFCLESSSSDGDGCQTERKRYNTETVRKVLLHDRRAVQNVNFFWRLLYDSYSDEERARVGKHASEMGVTNTSSFFKDRFVDRPLKESTVRGWKLCYEQELKQSQN